MGQTQLVLGALGIYSHIYLPFRAASFNAVSSAILHPNSHLFYILLLNVCSSFSFLFLFLKNFLSSQILLPACFLLVNEREKKKKGGFGGEEWSSGHFWASDKGMKELLAAPSNCGWCFCDVGYVTSHLGGSWGQTHPLTYFPEHICLEDRRNLLKREHRRVSVPWHSSKLAI